MMSETDTDCIKVQPSVPGEYYDRYVNQLIHTAGSVELVTGN